MVFVRGLCAARALTWALAFVLAGLTTTSLAQAAPRIELLTFSPGDAIWERFGHTALRVREGRSDQVYSFGHGPFGNPMFVWSFLRREADFMVVDMPFTIMLKRYELLNRTIERQMLSLSAEQSRFLADELARQVIPPHNRYRYDQLYDNCSTRVRDLIDRASGGALRRASENRHPGRSFRDYTREASAGHPIANWALELIGGPHQDLPVDGWAEMYLPAALRDRVAEAFTEIDGQRVPLTGVTLVLMERHGPPALSGNLEAARASLLGGTLALCALVWLVTRRGTHSSPGQRRVAATALVLLALMFGVFSFLVTTLVSVSRVHDFAWNENVLLFVLFDLALIGLALRWARAGRPGGRLVRGYLALRGAVIALVIVLKLAGVLPQQNWVFVAVAAFGVLAFARVACVPGTSQPVSGVSSLPKAA